MILLFCVTVGIAIILHEFAHFLAAKYVKCKVEIVSLGFGRPILKKKIGETTYQICPIPLGGYCKLFGELTYSRSKYAFTNLPYSKKLLIAMAGCAMNICTGFIAIIFSWLFNNFYLFYFGIMSLMLGVTNLLPVPCLDGSYPLLVLLEKKYGKKKGYALMEKIVKIGFAIILFLNLASIPVLIYWYQIGLIK